MELLRLAGNMSKTLRLFVPSPELLQRQRGAVHCLWEPLPRESQSYTTGNTQLVIQRVALLSQQGGVLLGEECGVWSHRKKGAGFSLHGDCNVLEVPA